MKSAFSYSTAVRKVTASLLKKQKRRRTFEVIDNFVIQILKEVGTTLKIIQRHPILDIKAIQFPVMLLNGVISRTIHYSFFIFCRRIPHFEELFLKILSIVMQNYLLQVRADFQQNNSVVYLKNKLLVDV